MLAYVENNLIELLFVLTSNKYRNQGDFLNDN